MKPQRRFQFIDNSNVSTTGRNSTQVRRHVMQEYMREKRWEARSQAETSVFDQEPQPHVFEVPQVEVRRKITRRRNKNDLSTIGSRPSPDDPTTVTEKAVVLLPRKDSLPRAEARNSASIEQRYHPNLWHQFDQRVPQRPKRGFFLDGASFARLADMVPSTCKMSYRKTFDSANQSEFWPAPTWFKYLHSTKATSLSPATYLSAARTDPFDVLPMQLSPNEKELFDFYATIMPYPPDGREKRHRWAHNWVHEVLIPEAMRSPLAFQSIVLQHAAKVKPPVTSFQALDIARQKDRAAASLRRHYHEFPDDYTDHVISATISAVGLGEDRSCPEHRHFVWWYWSAAMQKIRQCGGPKYLEQRPSLRKLVLWEDYTLSGYDGRGSSFYFTPEDSFEPGEERECEIYSRQVISRQAEEFLIFLKCIDQLAWVAASQSTNLRARQLQHLRYSIFAAGQSLHDTLANQEKPLPEAMDFTKQKICRLAVLIMINVAVWEHRHNTEQSEAFFEELVSNIIHNRLDKHRSVEVLLQIMLCDSENSNLGHTERPWLVGRLLKVSKRLSKESWDWLNDFLWSRLALDNHPWGQLERWKDRLRQEILEAPLYNHNLAL